MTSDGKSLLLFNPLDPLRLIVQTPRRGFKLCLTWAGLGWAGEQMSM